MSGETSSKNPSTYKIVNGLKLVDGRLMFDVCYGPGLSKLERLNQGNKVAIAEFWLELEKTIKASRILKPILAESKEENLGADTSGSQATEAMDDVSSEGSSFFAKSSEVEASSGAEDPEEDITNDSLAKEIVENYTVVKRRGAYISDDSD